MRSKLFAGLLATFFLIIGCNKPKFGAGKLALDEAYKNNQFVQTVYSESMIRSAASVANLDSIFVLTGNTEYVLQFELDRNSRNYNMQTDSIILWHVENEGLVKLVSVQMDGTEYDGYILDRDGVVLNAVYLERDSVKTKMYEFVGEIPFSELFSEGFSNYTQFGDLLNLDILTNARNDSTNP